MVSKEEAFKEVLNITEKFPVKHPSTPEQVSEVKKSITKRLAKINGKLKKNLITAIGCMVLMFLFSGCQKQYDEPNPPRIEQGTAQKLITQTFTLQTVTTEEIGTKGAKGAMQFDPAQWQYVYSDVPYTLTIQSATNTYTKVVSVQDMLSGGVQLSMVAGNYSVTYTPTGLPKVDTKLSVSISMTNILVTGTPIILQGQLASSLVIVDMPIATNVYCPYPQQPFTYDSRGFYYGYIHTYLNDANMSTVEIKKNDGTDDIMWNLDNTTNPAFALGKVYWLQNSMGITVQLNIPAMTVIPVVVN